MQTYVAIMHSMASRGVRVVGGFWLALYGADLSPGYALMLTIFGTAIAVTGIADICPAELVVNATHRDGVGPQRRAA
jgi:hypothetical protein